LKRSEKEPKMRRQPLWIQPFKQCCNEYSSKIDCVAELVESAYKLFLERQKGRKTSWLNLLKNNRYKTIIIRFIEQLGNLLNSYGIELNTKAECIKICYDYFVALDEYHKAKGHNGFFFNQIAGMYALEVFINWCEENFSSVERYFEIGLEKKEAREKKEKEIKASVEEQAVEKMKEQTKMKRSKIKGLMEIEFLS
jgi:hypothetical protein